MNSKSRYTYLSWGKIEQEKGDIDRARELFLKCRTLSVQTKFQFIERRGHSLNESDPALLQALALLESKFGDIKDARRYFRKVSFLWFLQNRIHSVHRAWILILVINTHGRHGA